MFFTYYTTMKSRTNGTESCSYASSFRLSKMHLTNSSGSEAYCQMICRKPINDATPLDRDPNERQP